MFPDKIVCTEASSFACAGFTVETYTRVVHKMWSSEEALKSSTYIELKAVFKTLFSLQEVFQNRLVKMYTDNQNVVSITNTGSMKSELQSLAIEIFNLCIRSFLTFSINCGVHLLATFLQIQIITRQICSFLHIGAPDQVE